MIEHRAKRQTSPSHDTPQPPRLQYYRGFARQLCTNGRHGDTDHDPLLRCGHYFGVRPLPPCRRSQPRILLRDRGSGLQRAR